MGVAQTTRRRRFARSSSPCFIGSFLIHDVVRRDCHSGIAPRGFVSMRDRQHRIARPRPATIMTYRSACGCRSNRAHPFSEERSRAQSAISPDRTTVVRPWLWRVGFAAATPPSRAGGLSLQNGSSPLFEHEIFSEDRRRASFPNDSLRRSRRDYRAIVTTRTDTWNFGLRTNTHYISRLRAPCSGPCSIVAAESGTAVTWGARPGSARSANVFRIAL